MNLIKCKFILLSFYLWIYLLIYYNRYGVTTRSLVIRASTHIVLGNFSSCDELLKIEDISSQSKIDITPLLILKAQTFILRELYSKAEEVINQLNEDLKYSPAVISTIYQLKVLQQNSENTKPSSSILYLLSIAKKLEDSSLNISDTNRTFSLYQISQELDENGYYQESANVLQTIINRYSSSIDSSERFMISSKIAIALSYVSPTEAEKVTRSLPKVKLYLFISFSFLHFSFLLFSSSYFQLFNY